MSKAEVDNRTVESRVKKDLTRLEEYMVEVAKDDIIIFNSHVKDQLDTLSRRGVQNASVDMVHLFDGYVKCSDRKFVEFIERLRDEWEDNGTLTPRELMAKAETRYSSRLEDWKKPSEDQEQIIALRAQVLRMEKQRSNQGGGHKTPPAKPGSGKEKPGKRPGDGGPPKIVRRRVYTGTQEWRNKMDGELLSKEVNGATWEWCIYHSAYCKHNSTKCYGNPKNGGHKILDEEGKTIPTPSDKETGLGKSLTASMANVGIDDVMEDEDEDEDEK
jgi:hypothetical protein